MAASACRGVVVSPMGRAGAAVLVSAMIGLGWIVGDRFGLAVTGGVALFVVLVLAAFEVWGRLFWSSKPRPGYLIPPADDYPRGAP